MVFARRPSLLTVLTEVAALLIKSGLGLCRGAGFPKPALFSLS